MHPLNPGSMHSGYERPCHTSISDSEHLLPPIKQNAIFLVPSWSLEEAIPPFSWPAVSE